MTKQYAKLISETSVQFPPKNKGSIINYNLNTDLLIADGYKEFISAEKEIGKSYTISYKETKNKITEIATEIPQPPPKELLQQAKEAKSEEASRLAAEFIQSGSALYEFEEGKHIEATDGNIGKFTAYALAYVIGQLTPADTVVWNTKEDETVNLTQTQAAQILNGLGAVQADIWTNRYPDFLSQIEQAATVDEVYAIEINYEREVNNDTDEF